MTSSRAVPTFPLGLDALNDGVMVAIHHGSDGQAARPDGESCYWVGDVEPANGEDGDIWLDLFEKELLIRSNGTWMMVVEEVEE